MTRYRGFRWFAYALEIFVVFVIQETPGLLPPIYGARPVAVIPVVLSIALFENEVPAMMFGLFGGLLIDFGFGGVLGFHGLVLSLVCYVISVMASNFVKTSFVTSMLVSITTTAAVMLLNWACFYVLHGYQHITYALTAHYIPIFIYTVALTPITYFFNRALAVQIRSDEEE